MIIKSIHTGYFKLDGGGMFGIVPKRMWYKMNPADENNMCTWSMRALYVETDNKKIVIDTGLGNKQDDKFRSHFEPFGSESLLSSLGDEMIDTSSITDVILTHLHFDHVGGALYKDEKGNIHPTFPNATYWSNEKQWNWAMNPNPKEAASFLKENFVPLRDMGILQFIDIEQDVQFCDGINIHFTYGHTDAMMLPIIQNKKQTFYYCADTLPSSFHIGMPYVMAFDIRPLDSMVEKAALLERTLTADSYVLFEHDPKFEAANLVRDEKNRIVLGNTYNLNQLV
jgi:glyoxylase-like metal-dependent hydrolase (beta-lactamase superfamily II)